MKHLTSVELSNTIKNMTAEELIEQVTPLLKTQARAKIPGWDYEEILNELREVAWRCHTTYTVSKGSFLNYLIRSIRNKLTNMRKTANNQFVPIASFKCSCGYRKLYSYQWSAPICPECNQRTKISRSGNLLSSLDQRIEVSHFDLEDKRSPYVLAGMDVPEADDYSWEDPEAPWRAGLTKLDIKMIEHALRGDTPLSDNAKERLKWVVEDVIKRL